MALTGQRLEPAPLRDRFAAGLIDSGGAIGLLGGVAVAGLEQLWPDALERLRGVAAGLRRFVDWTNSPHGRRANQVVTVIWGVAMRNTRTPGMRIMRLRRVDARTGGPVTLHSALRRAAFGMAWSACAKRVTHPTFERYRARAKQAQDDLEAYRRTHSGDPRADAEFYSAQRGLPGASCCGTILALYAIQQVPVTFTSRRQDLFGWASGTMVVRD
jgi:hypothetical protein